MYRKLIRTKSFIKDSEKLRLTDQHYSKFIIFIGKILSNEQLPDEAKDHILKGNWIGYREFHISGDIIVIYKVQKESIILVRIGSHSQLFD
jgi:mRNA interferase YafQ